MSQIDISQWKDIPLNQLFDVARSKSIDKRYLSFVDKNTNTIEFIGRTSINNGIQGYVLKDSVNFEPNPSNSLSIIQIGHNWATWHDKPWYAAQNIFCLIPKKDQVYEHNVHMFLQSVINKKLQQYQGFTTYPKVTDIKKMTLKLPVDKNGDPDWQYMDTYIAKLTALAHKNVSSLKKAKAKPAKLNIDQWGEFKVSDLFDFDHGKRLTKKDRIPGKIPFCTAGAENQGIADYLNGDCVIWHKPITIDMFGNTFYHNFDCAGDDNIYALINNDLSKTSKIFITSVLNRQLKQKFSFKDQFRQSDLDHLVIKLPIDAKGEPDWEYMDNQVRHLAALSNLTITSLDPAKLPIFIGEWKEFLVNKVFNVFTGTQVPRRYLINGSQERISVTNENNGVISKFDENELLKSSNARILTNFVSINFFGYAFYHKNKASLEMKVHAIQRKDDVSFSENQGLYIASLLNSQYAGKYGYGNQLSSSKLKNKVIKLPVDLQGDPDWQYMDQYINWIKQYSKNKLTLIQ